MADQGATDGANAAGEPAPEFRILTQYVKDLSFENPNAPQSLGPMTDQPQIDVRVDVGVQRFADTDYEVKLTVGIEAKAASGVMFLVELQYCGLFRLANIPADSLEPMLLIECPRQIFPFARRVIADVTRDGGFPPLMIDPIDFVNLYQQRRAGVPEGTVPN
ncbi:MAG: protein-export chaperone SecB [Parvibaculum sp.]|nr:protein-export chaperone SecB [Parvibaculum sp.]|tara:strand:- start:7086 stop:7571 length:486 start_codon:yes stop_codon:yes gene_type:complete